MSDNDTQDSNAPEETIEFSSSHFGEEPVEESPSEESTAAPTEPTAEPVETPSESTEPPAEEPKEPETPEPPEPAEPEEPKTESELKGMTRAERREYFQNLQRETQPVIEKAVNEAYQPQEVSELQDYYMQQGADEFQALQLARQDIAEQKTQIAEATAEITQLNANLQVDAVEARAKYDWMNPTSENFDKDLTNMAAELFEGYTVKDPRTGQIVDAKKTPMQIATLVNTIRNSGNAKAQLAAQKAAEQEMAAVAPRTSTAPPASESPEDKQAAALERALNNTR